MKKKKKKGASSSSKAEPKEEVEAPAPEAVEDTTEQPQPSQDADDTAVEEAKAEGEPEDQQEDKQDDKLEDKASESSPSETPSLAQQSKLRSTSFRAGSLASPGPMSPGPFSPEGDTAPDIYRKHVARIEELEKENKRIIKEAADSEKRWKKAEEELADLRESDGKDDKDGQTEKLVRKVERNRTLSSAYMLQELLTNGAAEGGDCVSTAPKLSAAATSITEYRPWPSSISISNSIAAIITTRIEC